MLRSQRVKVLPCPSSLSTVTQPSWARKGTPSSVVQGASIAGSKFSFKPGRSATRPSSRRLLWAVLSALGSLLQWIVLLVRDTSSYRHADYQQHEKATKNGFFRRSFHEYPSLVHICGRRPLSGRATFRLGLHPLGGKLDRSPKSKRRTRIGVLPLPARQSSDRYGEMNGSSVSQYVPHGTLNTVVISCSPPVFNCRIIPHQKKIVKRYDVSSERQCRPHRGLRWKRQLG